MRPTVSSEAPLNSLGQGKWNKEQHYSTFYVTPLASVSASHDTNGVVNETTELLGSRKLKCGAT